MPYIYRKGESFPTYVDDNEYNEFEKIATTSKQLMVKQESDKIEQNKRLEPSTVDLKPIEDRLTAVENGLADLDKESDDRLIALETKPRFDQEILNPQDKQNLMNFRDFRFELIKSYNEYRENIDKIIGKQNARLNDFRDMIDKISDSITKAKVEGKTKQLNPIEVKLKEVNQELSYAKGDRHNELMEQKKQLEQQLNISSQDIE